MNRYSTITLKILRLDTLGTLATHTDAKLFRVSGTEKLSRAGSGSISFSAREATLLSDIESNHGQVITAYVTDQVAGGADMNLATFIIENVDIEVRLDDPAGDSRVTVSGPDLIEQLSYFTKRDIVIDDGAGGVTTNDVTDILDEAPANWSTYGASGTTVGTFHSTRGETALKLLVDTAERTGEFFRLRTYANPTSKQLHWLASPDSSGITLRQPTTYGQYDGSTTTGILYTLKKNKNSARMATRVRLYGPGIGDDRFTIRGIDASDTGGDPSWATTAFFDYQIVNNDLETSLSYTRSVDKDFPWIYPDDPSDTTQETTSKVELWKAGIQFLIDRNNPREYASATCNVAANIRPGMQITVSYDEYEGGATGGSQVINVNDSYTVLEVTNTFTNGERITSLELGDAPIAKPTADDFVAQFAQTTEASRRKSDVTGGSGSVHPEVTLTGDASDVLTIGSAQLLDLAPQTANTTFAGPVSGGDDLPAFRTLVDADIPSSIARDSELHDEVTLGGAASAIFELTGQLVGMHDQTANTILAGPTSGGATTPAFRTLVADDIPGGIQRNITAGDGLGLSGVDVFMETPSTITAATSNGVTASSHVHAVTTSSTGSASTIAAFNSNGRLQAEDFILPDNGWIGLGSSAGRLLFDNQATDEAIFLSCNVGINTNTPQRKLHIVGTSGGVTFPTSALTGTESLIVENAGSNSSMAILSAANAYSSLKFVDAGASSIGGHIYHKHDTGTMVFGANGGTEAMYLKDGLRVGLPTGGDKGAGTINVATGIYKNNTAYTNPDYALEAWVTGDIVQFAGNPGAANYRRYSLAEIESYIRDNLRLPGIEDRPHDIFERADFALQYIEEIYTHIIELNHRLKEVENGNP
jgi:hypothetical protein